MNEILNRNNRTQSEVSFEINRKIDSDEDALVASAAAGNERALAVLASRVAFFAGACSAENDAALADAKAASRSANSVTSSIKAAAAAQNLETQVRNAAEKVRKAAVYQELLVSLAAAKAAKAAKLAAV